MKLKKDRNDKTITDNIKLSKTAEELLEAMKTEYLRRIESAHVLSVKNAWYYSYLGSLDFARQMGLISEEHRQELCREFSKAITNIITK
jgi:predicted Rossmann-fold nucleotide-binding protein